MKDALRSFAADFGLTPRETEVLQLLANEIVGLKNIAEHLKLSPHTVNNHFKSIFEKTKSNSRTQLLASFLKYSQSKAQGCKHLHKKPRVMIVDDDPTFCESLSKALTRKGVRAYSYSDPAKAIEMLPALRVDVVVSDIQMPGLTGIQLLEELRKIYKYFPAVVFISGFSGVHDEWDLMNLGAAALIDKPVDLDKLFNLVMEQFLDDRQERQRHLKGHDRVALETPSVLKIENLGFGGAFLPVDFEKPGSPANAFKVGDVIAVEFELDGGGRKINTKGEVVWKRPRPHKNLETGIGVKFVDLSDADRDSIQEFAQLHHIHSFIPNGLRQA